MSTRCNIVLTETYEKKTTKFWLYRHSDGYPEGALPTLLTFMDWLESGKIRNNIDQSAGWLIVLGHLEYRPEMGWKVGAIEPTTWGMHGDIEYLYTIDLTKKTLTCQSVTHDWGNPPDYTKQGKPILKKVSLTKYIKEIRENQKKELTPV
jgi:hypothetical protein